MKKPKTYQLLGKITWFLLLPLMVFLLFSCPVKRSLFSSFNIQDTTVEYSSSENLEVTQTFHTSLSCSQTYLEKKKEAFQDAALATGIQIPIAIAKRFIQVGQIKPASSFTTYGHATPTQIDLLPIFLKLQSFLI